MSREPKGFFMSLPYAKFGDNGITRGISFQLTADGARYFFVSDGPREKKEVRDISTQYRTMTGSSYASYSGIMRFDRHDTLRAYDRLIKHARTFYPELCIPDEKMPDPYPWVAFPMIGAAMKGSERRAPYGVNLQIASGLRAFTVQDMTTRIFGEAPKQLQAAMASSMTKNPSIVNIDNLTLASLVRGYLPPNQIAEILHMDIAREGWVQQIDKISANNIRLLLRRFNSHRLMRILQSFAHDSRMYNNADMLLRDAANQYADARKHHPTVVMDLSRQYKTLEELHESVTREYRKLANANVGITYSDELTGNLESIHLPEGARLVWPSCTHELMDWASDKAMNNCIYAYGKDAAAGRCLLLAVLDSAGKMIINIMVRGGDVIQCYGKSNQIITDEPLLESVFKGLIDAKIVNPENDHKAWIRRSWY